MSWSVFAYTSPGSEDDLELKQNALTASDEEVKSTAATNAEGGILGPSSSLSVSQPPPPRPH